MPTYNSELFIEKTIDSIISQTYKKWELIITDDYSNDNTYEILRKFEKIDSRIKVFRNKENLGAAYTRNNCLQHLTYNYLAFIDSDDLWFKDKLRTQLEFMKKNRYAMSFTSYELIDEEGNKLNKIIKSVNKIDYEGYLKNTIIGMSTSMINLELTGKIKFKDIRTRQDTYLWISLLREGLISYGLDIVLTSYRVRSDSISSNKFKAIRQVWKLYYDYEKISFLKSTNFLLWYIYNAIKKRYF